MREAAYDYVFSNRPLAGSRQLEPGVWESYIVPDCELGTVMAYHWKATNVSDFSSFAKYKFEKNNWKTIGTFLLVLLVLGIVSAIIGGIIVNWLAA